MYKRIIMLATILAAGLVQAAAPDQSTTADSGKTGDGKGITVDDLGRGLKSAVNNIEKEIPKAGSAIGNVFKKITEKTPEKQSSHEPAKQSK